MIKAEKINKSFGNLQVLNQVDLHIAQGEIVSIVGPSGAGKTTLLQILGTLSKADSGLLQINNVQVSALNDKQLSQFRNQQVGFVFQFHQLLPEFTAVENVCIPALIGNKNRKKAEERAKELLDFFGLSARFGHKPAQLSGGEQQRVAVARALMNEPAVILADEPSGNLDTKNKEDLHATFFKLRDTFNQTFVIVTHDMELAKMSDRVVYMRDGRIDEEAV